MGELEGGSLLTAEMADRHGRPWLHVDLDATSEEVAARRVAVWPADLPGDVVLIVAGQRESKSPGIGATWSWPNRSTGSCSTRRSGRRTAA